MLYDMPGLGRQINKLDTDKAILAAPDYNCEHQLSKFQHAPASFGVVIQDLLCSPACIKAPVHQVGLALGSTAAMLNICCASKDPHHTTHMKPAMRQNAQCFAPACMHTICATPFQATLHRL